MESDPCVLSVQDVKAVQLRPGVCRLKAEIHLDPWLLCDIYLAKENDENIQALTESCKSVKNKEDARRFLRQYSQMYMITMCTEMDRIESAVRKKFPEFRHIDLEVL